MSEILAIPKTLAPKRQAVNTKVSCITDTEVLKGLKHRKEEKEATEEEKRIRKLEKEKKKKEREMVKKPSKRWVKANNKKKVEARVTRSKSDSVKILPDLISNLDISETEESGNESEAECPVQMTMGSGCSMMCVRDGGT